MKSIFFGGLLLFFTYLGAASIQQVRIQGEATNGGFYFGLVVLTGIFLLVSGTKQLLQGAEK